MSLPEGIFSLKEVQITYGFRGFTAVDNLSLTLKKGESLALLGLNGAGKTSTIRLLMGMLRPKKGSVSVFGGKPGTVSALSRIGFAPEDAVPPEYLTARDYLHFVASFRVKNKKERSDSVDGLLDFFELPAKQVRELSKGMRRKLILARAFLGNPDLLILDEPLNGLDPLFIIKLRDKIAGYLKAGGSLLFSSHILAEVEKVCDQVGIIKQGQLVCLETASKLVSEHGSIEKAFAELIK